MNVNHNSLKAAELALLWAALDEDFRAEEALIALVGIDKACGLMKIAKQALRDVEKIDKEQ